jgi:hypothetical protein
MEQFSILVIRVFGCLVHLALILSSTKGSKKSMIVTPSEKSSSKLTWIFFPRFSR